MLTPTYVIFELNLDPSLFTKKKLFKIVKNPVYSWKNIRHVQKVFNQEGHWGYMFLSQSSLFVYFLIVLIRIYAWNADPYPQSGWIRIRIHDTAFSVSCCRTCRSCPPTLFEKLYFIQKKINMSHIDQRFYAHIWRARILCFGSDLLYLHIYLSNVWPLQVRPLQCPTIARFDHCKVHHRKVRPLKGSTVARVDHWKGPTMARFDHSKGRPLPGPTH